MILLWKKLDQSAIIPTRAHDTDLGYDLYVLESIVLKDNDVTKIRTGIACKLPHGYGALIRDRSSVATKKNSFVVAGVIDNGYTGELIVDMYKTPYINDSWHYGNKLEAFNKGEKIAQLILIPIVTCPDRVVDELPTTERGEGGFGSTGE
jgi:dUTP pyrophosphatase